jgi:fatty-acyl-CoA synthase
MWRDSNFAEVFLESARAGGEAEALVTPGARLSYHALLEETLVLARAMDASGLRKGDHIAILMGNDEYWVQTFFAAALIGAVTVPLNTRFKTAELSYCLEKADVKAIFLADRFLKIDFVALLAQAEPAILSGLPGAALPRLELAVVVGEDVPAGARSWAQFRALGSSEKAWKPAAPVSPSDPMLIQFTSGTTAFPKAAVLAHDSMLRDAWALGSRMGIRSTDRYFNTRPFSHLGGSVLSVLVALISRACLVTLPTFEARGAVDAMARERCTLTSGNDTIFQMLMAEAASSGTRLCLRGGWIAAGPETTKRVMGELGARDICTAYGLSEASGNVAATRFDDSDEQRLEGWLLPHDGLEIRIADPESGRALTDGADGEILVRGWCVMQGYYKDPAMNSTTLTADGWLRTGDLGRAAAGRFRFLGRLKDMFRVGGENVAPAEVEGMLLRHPAVQTAQVVGVPDARLGEVPAAYVQLRPGARISVDELKAWTKQNCATFRVPRYLRFVDNFDAIGVTASGKIQKSKLRQQAIEDFIKGTP